MQKHAVLALAAVAIASLFLNGFLIVRGNTGKPAITSTPTSVPSRLTLTPGIRAPILRGRDLSGSVVSVDYMTGGKPTVLYVITPGCVWCTRNEASFAALVRDRAGSYNFVLVSLAEAGLRENLARVRGQWGGAPVRVVMNLPEDSRAALRLGNTPHTIVISPEGQVLESWEGAYTLNRQTAIENYFLVRLPGVVLGEKSRAF